MVWFLYIKYVYKKKIKTYESKKITDISSYKNPMVGSKDDQKKNQRT